jgi:hypothetical protein
MKEKIINIKEVHDVELKYAAISRAEGYLINTEKATYYFLIEQDQCCCESFGYLSTPDDFNDFVGADLLSIKRVTVNDCVKQNDLEERMNQKYDPAQTMFINIETSNGLLQFAAYNEHNGYYGHFVIMGRLEIIENDCL